MRVSNSNRQCHSCVGRTLIFLIVVCCLVSLGGCDTQSGASVGEIEINPTEEIPAGGEAHFSIELTEMATSDIINWSATAGVFRSDTTQAHVVWNAPPEKESVTIRCKVTIQGRTSLRSKLVQVVALENDTEAAEPSGDLTLSATNRTGSEPKVSPESASVEAPVFIKDEGFVASGWMGDAQRGEPVVKVENQHSTNPHSPPFCERWTYSVPKNTQGWAAVCWQFPGSNWGAAPGKDYSGRGYSKVTFWVRGEPAVGGRLPKVQFKAGGNVNSPSTASFEASTSFIFLSDSWTQLSIDIPKKLAGCDDPLSNVVSAFTWVCRVEDNPEGAIFYIDDLRYE